jgi:DUF917 family protein
LSFSPGWIEPLGIITADAIEYLCAGAELLAAGGGQDLAVARLVALQALSRYGPVPVKQPEDMDPDALVVSVALIGSPAVSAEKPPSEHDLIRAVSTLTRVLDKEPVALMSVEMGGFNALAPIAAAAQLGLPILDADAMRRALPQIEMTTFALHGIPASPFSLVDSRGNALLFHTESNESAELLVRNNLKLLGLTSFGSTYPLTARQVRECGIPHSLSYTYQLGRLLLDARQDPELGWAALLEFTGGRHLVTGQVIEVERRRGETFPRGTVLIEDATDGERLLRVEMQNEYLVALEDGLPLVTPPDLLCLLDADYLTPVSTDQVERGLPVELIALPCAEEWKTKDFERRVGPRAFGYDIDYQPLGTRGRYR